MALKQEAAAYLGDDEVSVAASVRENLVRNEETAVLIEWMVANLGDEARGLVTEPHTDPYEHAISLARAANGLVESLDVFSPDEKASYRQRLGESISRVFVQDRDLLLDPEMRFFVDAMVAFLPSGLPASATTIVNISSAARALLPGLQDTALRTEHRSIGELQELLIGHIQTIAFDIGQRRFVSDFETFSQEDDVRLRATLQNEIKNKQIRFKVKTNELDPKARKLRDAIEVDALKHALDEARTSGSMPDLIEAENQAFATIVREIHKYPSQDFLWEFASTCPAHILATRQVICLARTQIAHAFLQELGLRHEVFSIQRHSALAVYRVDGKRFCLDPHSYDRLMPLPGKDDTEKLGDFEIFPQVKYHGDVDMIAQSYDAKMGIMAQLFTNLWSEFMRVREYRKAVVAYDNALRLYPKLAAAWYKKALAHFELREYPQALEAHDRAVALRPDDHSVWTDRSTALFRAGRFQEAMDLMS